MKKSVKNLFLIILFLPAFIFAKGYGIVTLLKGHSEVQTSDGKKTELKKGDKVFESDTVITADKSIVRIVMVDTNIIDVYPNSKLLIKEYIYNPKENQKNVRLEVSEGRIKSTVKQKYDNEINKYNVKTPVVVAGVRGTIFTTEHEKKSGESRITTHEGNVMVGRLDANDQVKEFLSVKANQTVQMDRQTAKPEVKDIPKPDVEKQKNDDQKNGFVNVEKEREKKEEKPPKLEEKSPRSDEGGVKSDGKSGEKSDEKKSGTKKDKDSGEIKDDKKSEVTEELKKKRRQDEEHRKHDNKDHEEKKKKELETVLPSPISTTPPNTETQ